MSLNRIVAIKVLEDSGFDSQRCLSRGPNARQTASLEHRCSHHAGQTLEQEPTPYLVMEHVNGGPITRMSGVQALAGQEAQLFQEILAARSVPAPANDRIVHGDIKPTKRTSSIMTMKHPKLLDFGIARMIQDAGRHQHDAGLVTRGPMPVPNKFVGNPHACAMTCTLSGSCSTK